MKRSLRKAYSFHWLFARRDFGFLRGKKSDLLRIQLWTCHCLWERNLSLKRLLLAELLVAFSGESFRRDVIATLSSHRVVHRFLILILLLLETACSKGGRKLVVLAQVVRNLLHSNCRVKLGGSRLKARVRDDTIYILIGEKLC